MIGLAKIIQNVIIFGMNAKLFKLFLERSGLFKKAIDFINFDELPP